LNGVGVVLVVEYYFAGAAGLAEAGEIPKIGKIAALLWFDGVDGAIAAVKEDAFTVGFVLESQTLAIAGQASELLDEIEVAEAAKGGDACDFIVGQTNLSGPPAAGGTAIAFEKNRHWRKMVGTGRNSTGERRWKRPIDKREDAGACSMG
jgi:hypothetical protein